MESVIEHDSHKAQQRLANLYPDELGYFKRKFLWTGNRGIFYVRYAYDSFVTPQGKKIHKWQPYHSHLYPALVDSLAEKHLDFERFCRTRQSGESLRTEDWETAFWVGILPGKYTYHHVIDLDSHDYIGWIPIPSRWYQYAPDAWADRSIPVVRPSLRFFMTAKLVHDSFRNRLWTFSSANFGLAIWRLFGRSQDTNVLYRQQTNRLASARLSHLEHYPQPPSSADSDGRCHRRPCGIDSAVLTSAGVIRDPIEQIRAFMTPPLTPTFEEILSHYWKELEASYRRFLDVGFISGTNTPENRQQLVLECRRRIDEIKTWSNSGCPIDWNLIAERKPVAKTDKAAAVEASPILQFDQDEVSEESLDLVEGIFMTCDLKRIHASGRTIQFVKFLVENGIPADDTLYPVVVTLAKWFGCIELFGVERDRVKTIIQHFVLSKNNGKVSRLLTGNGNEVLSQINRIVDSVFDDPDIVEDDVFATLRSKREQGHYSEVYRFEPLIMGHSDDTINTTPFSLLGLSCGGLIPPSQISNNWQYEEDLSPLPEAVHNEVINAFRKANRQLRKNRATGRCSTLDAITRLFNYLFSGRKIGTRRASQILLRQMGFPSKNNERRPMFNILVKAGLLECGGYRALSHSREFSLSTSVIDAFVAARTET